MKLGYTTALAFTGLWVWISGCSRPLPENALVLTQTSSKAQSTPPATLLDVRYPSGTRVVIAVGAAYQDIRVLSARLAAAGEPAVSCDGHRIVFAGKAFPTGDWQIYESTPAGGRSKALTSAPGGAMDPALLGDGTLLYVSPVPSLDGMPRPTGSPALFAQSRGGSPRQLTFGLAVSDPTVLSDGRILFVSPGASNTSAGSALYTINNDGTELSAYAGQHDAPAWLRRPRELDNARIVFLAGKDAWTFEASTEFVLSARPFASRARLFPNWNTRIRSIQPAATGDWLVCAQADPDVSGSRCTVFQVNPSAPAFERPILNDPVWASIEAVPAAAHRRPMGRLSNVDLRQETGQILCLNANDTTVGLNTDSPCTKAKRIRVFTNAAAGREQLLGEVEVQADGSFMAEVPANMPLGFEALDEHGTILRREPPLMWVRPGENRSCIGCHEPHNHSPHNLRPLAVRVAVPRLSAVPEKIAQRSR